MAANVQGCSASLLIVTGEDRAEGKWFQSSIAATNHHQDRRRVDVLATGGRVAGLSLSWDTVERRISTMVCLRMHAVCPRVWRWRAARMAARGVPACGDRR